MLWLIRISAFCLPDGHASFQMGEDLLLHLFVLFFCDYLDLHNDIL